MSSVYTLHSCWPFGGSQGQVGVQLAPRGRVVPRSVSVEHIPSSIAHTIGSAPKAMQVWGFQSVNDAAPRRLDAGDCQYDAYSPQSIQFCNLREDGAGRPVNIVQLRVLSNHGRGAYTCVYRFRVHGDLK